MVDVASKPNTSDVPMQLNGAATPDTVVTLRGVTKSFGRVEVLHGLDLDVRRIAGPDFGEYGIAFRVQPQLPGEPNNLRYAFRINSKGEYTLLIINADNSNTTVQPLTASPAIKKGGVVNHLTVVCKGETITLAANGTTLGMWKATLVKPGQVGVVVNSPLRGGAGLEGAFKDLRISPAP